MARGATISTRNLIISELGVDFPLSLRKVAERVTRHKRISSQAVHKVLAELVKEGILEKVDRQYLLSRPWIEEQTRSFSQCYTNYFNISYNQNEISPESSIQVFKFHSLKELVEFILQAYIKGELTKTGNVYISLKRLHPLIPTSIISLLRRIAKENKVYVLCESDLYADRITAKLLRTFGIKTKLGGNIPNRHSICFEDCVLQYYLFFSPEYKRKVHAFSDQSGKKSGMEILRMTADIFYKKADIYLTLIREPVIVGDIRDKIRAEFGIEN